MEIALIQDKKSWNNWFFNQFTPFTQSWEWGDILISEGKKVERLAVVEDGKIFAQAQIVYSQIVFGWRYAFCPKGIVISSQFTVHRSQIYECIAEYLKKQGCIFFRIEPDSIIQHSKFKIQKTIDINPSATLILYLNKSETELLAGMHQKTRYNIHLAEKKGLEIRNEKNLEIFWGLMNKTGSRDKFGLHSKKHYEQVLCSPLAWQLTAYYNNTPVACVVFVGFEDMCTYLYGASDYEYRNLMAPYLVQWEGIKTAQKMGYKQYDFFGVAPQLRVDNDAYEYDQKHQYAGVTRFKLGFGGVPQQASGTFDVVLDKKKYLVYSLLRIIRRLF